MAEQPETEKPDPKTNNKADSPWHRFVAWLRQQPVIIWLIKIWSPTWRTIRILWLCGYDVVAVLVVLFLFVFNAQGQDLLRMSAERSLSIWNLMFWIGTAALALTVWFTSRVLLGRKFANYQLEWDRAQRFQKWLPRVLGIAVPSLIAIGLLRIDSDIYQTEIWILCSLYFLLAVLVAVFIIFRRDWFGVAQDKMLEDQVTELEGGYLITPVVSVILAFVLLISFMIWPVGLPQWLGAPGIVMLAFVGIVWFGAMVLTYLPLSMGQPSATALALVLAVIFGLWIDNHYIRLSDKAVSLARTKPAQHYTDNWRTKHPNPTLIDGREPVIIVAAAGGGIRAAYWTATNLAKLEEVVPGFANNLFAISGVSGGSLGAATYVALKHTLEPGQPKILVDKVRNVLREDFLSPVLAGMLFPDLIQRFFFVSIPAADRQRFLELAWEQAMGSVVGKKGNPFPDAFTRLYSEDQKGLASLLLNTTVVDSGRRAIVSNLDISDFTDTRDLLATDLTTSAIRLSSAAGASARFTYVSPPGSLIWTHTTKDDGQLKTVEDKVRVVDGGYFENSGAATATDTFAALQNGAANKLFPILVLIRNDPKAPRICQREWFAVADNLSSDAASSWLDNLLVEVFSPVRALLNARTARARLAEVDAARAVEANKGAVIELPLGAVLRTMVAAAKGNEDEVERLEKQAIEPPLGWSLSNDVRKEMDEVLEQGGGGLSNEREMLQKLLKGDYAQYTPCNAR